jgi:hypothetical protein
MMGIRIIAGRTLDARDAADAPRVAVVSYAFAKRLAEDGATIGRRVRLSETGDVEWEVVGVVDDVQVVALDAESPPAIYLPHAQAEENRMTLVLRTVLPAPAVTNQLREIVRDMDPAIPVYAVNTLERMMDNSQAVFTRRLPMILCGVFAAASLALTLIALYAICMHEVESRRREFGIRVALGSVPSRIRRLVLGDALVVGAAGIAIGSVTAMAVSRTMRAVLYGIAPTDWHVYAIVGAGVLGAAMLATMVPALRAGAVDPALIMRAE